MANPVETLLTNSDDEPFTAYGLIAESLEWPEDRSWGGVPSARGGALA